MPSYLQYKKLMSVLDADDDIQWITVKGNHIPIKNGQNKEEAIKEFFEKKSGKSQESGSEKQSEKAYQAKKEQKKVEKEDRIARGKLQQEKTERVDKINQSKQEKVDAGAYKNRNLEDRKRDRVNEAFAEKMSALNGKVPTKYQGDYVRMMDRVHESAKKEITEGDAIRSAVKLAKDLGKNISKEQIENRMGVFRSYRENAKTVMNDLGKQVDVDTQMTYKKGGKFVNGEYVGGEYTEDRKAVHIDILNKMFGNMSNKIPKNGKPNLVILGGRGGSGKSQFTDKDKLNLYPEDDYVVIDPDKFKEQLPEYKNLVDSGSEYAGVNAWEVHEESSDLKKMALEMAKSQGANVVLDGTLSNAKVLKTIEEFKKAGYNVEGAYMHLPREKSTARGILRGIKGRLVPIGQLLEMKGNEDVFEQLMPEFSKWTIYDNDVPLGESPKLVAKSE